MVSEEEKKRLRIATAKFVSKDMQPISAIDREGVFELCNAYMQFGQKHPKATKVDLKMALPSRNTVKAEIAEMANDYKTNVSGMMK